MLTTQPIEVVRKGEGERTHTQPLQQVLREKAKQFESTGVILGVNDPWSPCVRKTGSRAASSPQNGKKAPWTV